MFERSEAESGTSLPAGQAGEGSWLAFDALSNLKTSAHAGRADMGRESTAETQVSTETTNDCTEQNCGNALSFENGG